MKTVLIYLVFGIVLAKANAKEIQKRNNDGRGSYGKSHFFNGKTFEHGNKKTEEKFHTYVDQFGNIISRVSGEVLQRGEGFYPTIGDNGKTVYTKSNFGSFSGYDGSTVTYGDDEKRGFNGDSFDGSGLIDVRFGGGLKQSANTDGESRYDGLNNDRFINIGQVGYRNINNGLSDSRSRNYYNSFRNLNVYEKSRFGLGLLFDLIANGGRLSNLGQFSNLGSQDQFSTVPIGGFLSRTPGNGLVGQKYDEINGGLNEFGQGGNGNGDSSANGIGSNGCSSCGDQKGKYAFASASASAGSYKK